LYFAWIELPWYCRRQSQTIMGQLLILHGGTMMTSTSTSGTWHTDLFLVPVYIVWVQTGSRVHFYDCIHCTCHTVGKRGIVPDCAASHVQSCQSWLLWRVHDLVELNGQFLSINLLVDAIGFVTCVVQIMASVMRCLSQTVHEQVLKLFSRCAHMWHIMYLYAGAQDVSHSCDGHWIGVAITL
jgi:hypothetical protein